MFVHYQDVAWSYASRTNALFDSNFCAEFGADDADEAHDGARKPKTQIESNSMDFPIDFIVWNKLSGAKALH